MDKAILVLISNTATLTSVHTQHGILLTGLLTHLRCLYAAPSSAPKTHTSRLISHLVLRDFHTLFIKSGVLDDGT